MKAKSVLVIVGFGNVIIPSVTQSGGPGGLQGYASSNVKRKKFDVRRGDLHEIWGLRLVVVKVQIEGQRGCNVLVFFVCVCGRGLRVESGRFYPIPPGLPHPNIP